VNFVVINILPQSTPRRHKEHKEIKYKKLYKEQSMALCELRAKLFVLCGL
jgi:hypothetical protein